MGALCSQMYSTRTRKKVRILLYFLLCRTLVHISISPFFASLSGKGAMASMALST